MIEVILLNYLHLNIEKRILYNINIRVKSIHSIKLSSIIDFIN